MGSSNCSATRRASSARFCQWLGSSISVDDCMDRTTLSAAAEFPPCGRASSTIDQLELFARCSALCEKFISLCDSHHNLLRLWIGQIGCDCTRLQSELAPVLCNVIAD